MTRDTLATLPTDDLIVLFALPADNPVAKAIDVDAILRDRITVADAPELVALAKLEGWLS